MAKGEWWTYSVLEGETDIQILYDTGNGLEVWNYGRDNPTGDIEPYSYWDHISVKILMDNNWLRKYFNGRPIPHSGPIEPLKGTRPTGAQNDAFWVEAKKPEVPEPPRLRGFTLDSAIRAYQF